MLWRRRTLNIRRQSWPPPAPWRTFLAGGGAGHIVITIIIVDGVISNLIIRIIVVTIIIVTTTIKRWDGEDLEESGYPGGFLHAPISRRNSRRSSRYSRWWASKELLHF